MACGQSIAHAWFMGAISRKRNRPSVSHGPSRASRAPEGFLLSEARRILRIPGGSRNGRPGSRGSRLSARGPSARGLSEGTRRKLDTDGRANLVRVRTLRRAMQSAAGEIFLKSGLPPLAAQPNAGGEDFGYFAPWKARVRFPPLASRTVEAAPQGCCVAGSGSWQSPRTCVGVTDTDIARSPACFSTADAQASAICLHDPW
jgi:hypothetical protein